MNIDQINEWIRLAMSSGILILIAVLIGLAIGQIRRMNRPLLMTPGDFSIKVYEDQKLMISRLEVQLARAKDQLGNYSQYEEMMEHAARTTNLNNG